MSASTTKSHRKILLINPKFQLAFVYYTIAMSILIELIFFGANEYFFRSLEKRGIDLGVPSDHIFFQFVKDERVTMTYIFLGCSAVATILFIGFGLVLSHRVAGPLYRLRKYFENDLQRSDCRPLSFREKDYFQELPEAINHGIQFIKRNEKPK